MVKQGDIVKIQTIIRNPNTREPKKQARIGTVFSLEEPEGEKQKIMLNINQEMYTALIKARPERKTYKGVLSDRPLTSNNEIIEIQLTKMMLPAFQDCHDGTIIQPFYRILHNEGKVESRYGNVSLKIGRTELFDLETGQIKVVDPNVCVSNTPMELHLFLSNDTRLELPEEELKIIQNKTRYVYNNLNAVFINTILLHHGCEVKDCGKIQSHFYLTQEKDLLCYLRGQTFYDFDRRKQVTLPATEFLVPLVVTATAKGLQGVKKIRNCRFF